MHQLLRLVPGALVRVGVVVEPGAVEGVPLCHPLPHHDLEGPGVVAVTVQDLHFLH